MRYLILLWLSTILVSGLVQGVENSTPPAQNITIIKDVAYRPADEPDAYAKERCKLDMYIPTQKGFPTLVWFHGGGLENGSRSGEKKFGTTLVNAGIACVAVDYRLSPKATYPAYITDAAASVAFVHRTIAEHGGDPKRVFVGGHSAGGYLTTMVVCDPQWLTAAGMDPHAIAGAVPISGQMITHFTVRKERGIGRDVEVVDHAAPLTHAKANMPPIFFITGDHDMKGRSDESKRMQAALIAAGNMNTLFKEYSDRDHNTIKTKMVEEGDPAGQALMEFVLRTK